MQKSESIPIEPKKVEIQNDFEVLDKAVLEGLTQPKTDDAKEVKLDIKVIGTPGEANEGGDYFPPPEERSGSSRDGIIEEKAEFHTHHEGCGCPSGATGTTGHPGAPARQTRKFRPPRRQDGRVIAVPGLSVICPLGSQLRAGKRIGPNDPCPCKSGKKYKKCCLNKE